MYRYWLLAAIFTIYHHSYWIYYILHGIIHINWKRIFMIHKCQCDSDIFSLEFKSPSPSFFWNEYNYFVLKQRQKQTHIKPTIKLNSCINLIQFGLLFVRKSPNSNPIYGLMMILCCVVHTKLYLRIQCLLKTNPMEWRKYRFHCKFNVCNLAMENHVSKWKYWLCLHSVHRVLGDLIYGSVTYELFVELQTANCGAATVGAGFFLLCSCHSWQRRQRLSYVKGQKDYLNVSFI